MANTSDQFAALLDQFRYERVTQEAQRKAIAKLRYEAYLREGLVSRNEFAKVTDPDDDAENAYLFGVFIDTTLASSIRLHVASREQPRLPSLDLFPEYLRPALDAGKRIIETRHFVADDRLARLYRGLPYVTLRLCLLAAEYFMADVLVAAVRPAHAPFYQQALNYKVVCQPRREPDSAVSIGLMAMTIAEAKAHLYRQYQFFHSAASERRELFETVTAFA
jgi:hypothetical protein